MWMGLAVHGMGEQAAFDITEPAVRRLVRDRRILIKPAKNHEVQPHLQ